jgi:FkbM family methyltransferase
MKESLKVNCSKNISLFQVALGDKDKEDIIYWDSEQTEGSSLNRKTSRCLPVRQVPLDSLVFGKKEIARVDFLKMDVEGSERSPILGARETISKFKPKLSICTYHLKDDSVVLPKVIKKINPNYKIEIGKRKLYARV